MVTARPFLFDGGDPADLLLWIGVANSLVMDFVVRKKVRLHMTYTVMDSLPFPRERRNIPAAGAIIARAFALTAVGPEMNEFRLSALDTLGMPQEITPVENQNERSQLFAEIEVLVARDVFGLTRDELRYVLDPDNLLGNGSGIETFRVLRDREYANSANIERSNSCWKRGIASSEMAHWARQVIKVK